MSVLLGFPQSGSLALIEFYPSDQLKKVGVNKNDYRMIRNNVTFNFSGVKHEVIETSERRYVLEYIVRDARGRGRIPRGLLGFSWNE